MLPFVAAMSRPFPLRRRCVFGFAALASLLSAAPEPIEGKWTGVLRHGADVADFGLEINRNEKNELIARFNLPAGHVVGATLAPLASKDGHYTAQGFDLTAAGDTLSGTFAPSQLSFELQRADTLPVPSPPPPAPTAPAPEWTYAGGQPFWATPVVRAGIAYVGDEAGVLHAVRADTGAPVWKVDLGAAIYGAAAIGPDGIYLVSDDGVLHALEIKDGRERWRTDLGGREVPRGLPAGNSADFDYRAPAPVLADSVLYIGSADGACHAIDAKTGASHWRFPTRGKIRADALLLPGRVVFASHDGHVYALNRADGALAWQFDTGGVINSAPVLAADLVIVGSRSAFIHALRADDGQAVWRRFQWFSWVESPPVVENRILYVGSSDNRTVRALDASTGATRWSTDVNGWAWAAPLIVGETIYASSAGTSDYSPNPAPEGSLTALDKRTGRILWRFRTEPRKDRYLHGFSGAPASDGTHAIVAGLDGILRAFR